MKQSKHTPGPWIISQCACGSKYCNDYVVSVSKSDGRLEEADARLVAAAPELLDALKVAKRIIENTIHHNSITNDMSIIRNVINKVEGELK